MGDPECDRAVDKVSPRHRLKVEIIPEGFIQTRWCVLDVSPCRRSQQKYWGAGGEEIKKVIIFMGIFKSDNAKSRVSCSIFFSFSYLQGDPFQLCLLTV